MKLNNKTYDILKWAVIIFFPAFTTLVGTVGTHFDWVYTQDTLVLLTSIATFLGTLLGISSHNYNKEEG